MQPGTTRRHASFPGTSSWLSATMRSCPSMQQTLKLARFGCKAKACMHAFADIEMLEVLLTTMQHGRRGCCLCVKMAADAFQAYLQQFFQGQSSMILNWQLAAQLALSSMHTLIMMTSSIELSQIGPGSDHSTKPGSMTPCIWYMQAARWRDNCCWWCPAQHPCVSPSQACCIQPCQHTLLSKIARYSHMPALGLALIVQLSHGMHTILLMSMCSGKERFNHVQTATLLVSKHVVHRAECCCPRARVKRPSHRKKMLKTIENSIAERTCLPGSARHSPAFQRTCDTL